MDEQQLAGGIHLMLEAAYRTVVEIELKKYIKTEDFQNLKNYNAALATIMSKEKADIRVGASPIFAKAMLQGIAWGHYERSNGAIRTNVKKGFDLPQPMWVNTSDVTEECCNLILQKMGYKGYQAKDIRAGTEWEIWVLAREAGDRVIYEEVAGWRGYHSELDSVTDYSFHSIEKVEVPYVPIYIVDKSSDTSREWLIGFIYTEGEPRMEMLDLVGRSKYEQAQKKRAEEFKKQEKKKNNKKALKIIAIILIIQIVIPLIAFACSAF